MGAEGKVAISSTKHKTDKQALLNRVLCLLIAVALVFSSTLFPTYSNTTLFNTVAWADEVGESEGEGDDDDEEETPTPTPTPQKTANNAPSYDPSLYSVASAAARYFDTVCTTGATDMLETEINVGQAGSAIGFVDPDKMDDPNPSSSDNTGVVGTLFGSVDADNVISVSYSALFNALASGSTNGFENSQTRQFGFYALFGSLLNQIGFDETTNTTGTNPERMILGNALFGAWYLSSAVDSIMSWCIDVVRILNPFAMFTDAADGVIKETLRVSDVSQLEYAASDAYKIKNGKELGQKNSSYVSDASQNAIEDAAFAEGAADDLRRTVAEIYTSFEDIGITIVVPIMAAGALVAFLLMLMLRKSSWRMGYNTGKLRRFLSRIVFIFIGVPILGGMYTICVDAVADYMSDSALSSDYIVAETLVDFGSWVEKSNLSLVNFSTTDDILGEVDPAVEEIPSKAILALALNSDPASKTITGTPTAGTMAGLRMSAFYVNAYYGGVVPQERITSIAGKLQNASVVRGTNGAVSSLISLVSAGENFNFNHDAIKSLIQRYSSGEKIEAGAYDSRISANSGMSGWKALYSHVDAYMDGIGDIKSETPVLAHTGMLNGTQGSREDQLKSAVGGIDGDFSEVVNADGEYLARDNWLANGSIKAQYSDADGVVHYCAAGSDERTSDNGLSNIAMFNYLNTKFDTTGLKIYSGENSANTQSAISHYSVNSIGTGLYGWLILINSILLMGVCGIVGLVYGIGLIFSTTKNGIQLIWSVPLALTGMIAMIARSVGLAILMCVEILATCILYIFMSQFLTVANSAVINIVPSFVDNATEAWQNAGVTSHVVLADVAWTGDGLQIATLAIACVMLLLFMIIAIKVRRSLILAVSEMVNHGIEVLTSSKPNVDASGSDISGAVGSVAGTAKKLGVTPSMAAAATVGFGAAGLNSLGASGLFTGSGSAGSVDSASGTSLDSAKNVGAGDTANNPATDKDATEEAKLTNGNGIENKPTAEQISNAMARNNTNEESSLPAAYQDEAPLYSKYAGSNNIQTDAQSPTGKSYDANTSQTEATPTNAGSVPINADQVNVSTSADNLSWEAQSAAAVGQEGVYTQTQSSTMTIGQDAGANNVSAADVSGRGNAYSQGESKYGSDAVGVGAQDVSMNTSTVSQGTPASNAEYNNAGTAASMVMPSDNYSAQGSTLGASSSYENVSAQDVMGASAAGQSNLYSDQTNANLSNMNSSGTANSYMATDAASYNSSNSDMAQNISSSEDLLTQGSYNAAGVATSNVSEQSVSSSGGMYNSTLIADATQPSPMGVSADQTTNAVTSENSYAAVSPLSVEQTSVEAVQQGVTSSVASSADSVSQNTERVSASSVVATNSVSSRETSSHVTSVNKGVHVPGIGSSAKTAFERSVATSGASQTMPGVSSASVVIGGGQTSSTPSSVAGASSYGAHAGANLHGAGVENAAVRGEHAQGMEQRVSAADVQMSAGSSANPVFGLSGSATSGNTARSGASFASVKPTPLIIGGGASRDEGISTGIATAGATLGQPGRVSHISSVDFGNMAHGARSGGVGVVGQSSMSARGFSERGSVSSKAGGIDGVHGAGAGVSLDDVAKATAGESKPSTPVGLHTYATTGTKPDTPSVQANDIVTGEKETNVSVRETSSPKHARERDNSVARGARSVASSAANGFFNADELAGQTL